MGEVDPALRNRSKFRRRRGQLAIEHSVFQSRVTADHDQRDRQPLEPARQKLGRCPLTLQAIAAAVDAERQPGRRPAREVDRCGPTPTGPAALAANGQVDGSLGTDNRRDKAVGGSENSREYIELVAVGLGIEMEGNAVTAVVDG